MSRERAERVATNARRHGWTTKIVALVNGFRVVLHK